MILERTFPRWTDMVPAHSPILRERNSGYGHTAKLGCQCLMTQEMKQDANVQSVKKFIVNVLNILAYKL